MVEDVSQNCVVPFSSFYDDLEIKGSFSVKVFAWNVAHKRINTNDIEEKTHILFVTSMVYYV